VISSIEEKKNGSQATCWKFECKFDKARNMDCIPVRTSLTVEFRYFQISFLLSTANRGEGKKEKQFRRKGGFRA
jgi:hypothetical protein